MSEVLSMRSDAATHPRLPLESLERVYAGRK